MGALFGQVIHLALAVVRAAIMLALALAAILLRFILAALDALRGVAAGLVMLLCGGVAVFGVAAAFEPVWLAYGGDAPALLPAACLLLVPVGYAVIVGTGWGGLALAGVLALVFGALLPVLHPAIRALAVTAVIGAVVYRSLTHGEVNHGETESE